MKKIPETRECQWAFLHAVFDVSGGFYLHDDRAGGAPLEILFTSESEETAAFILNVFEQSFGEKMSLIEAVRDPKHGRDKLTFSYAAARSSEISDAILVGYAEDEATDISYLCGAFLTGGSCTLPKAGKKTGYHLEVVFEDEPDAEYFQDILEEFQLLGSIAKRGDKHIVYLKSREAISDFLSVIGATKALRTFEKVSAEREENNHENRIVNCMAGNADRAATASVAQTVAFAELKKMGIAPTLPEQLRTVLEARLEYPTFSLMELAEKLNISKSCLNHRIRKLMQISKEKNHD